MFSALVSGWDRPSNALYRAKEDRLKADKPIIDLISANLNDQGVFFPSSLLARAIRQGIKAADHYHPHPLGQISARKAISQYYHNEGLALPPEQVLLTPGTSLSYLYAFKLLADPGDEILCPRPCYPLFDSIAQMAGVTLTYYPLIPHNQRWAIDIKALTKAITPRTRAIALISPHNPTGSVATITELSEICTLARKWDVPIIFDEVFSSFVYISHIFPRPMGLEAPLVLTLNGFSKMLGLAGIKIGWMGISGDRTRVETAIKALDMMSDTFLPVNEMAQGAVPLLLKQGQAFNRKLRKDLMAHEKMALSIFQSAHGVSVIPSEGGFYLTIGLDGRDEEEVALRLLNERGILVHPGYFYDLEGNHLIISLATKTSLLSKSLQQIIALLA